MFVCPPSLHSPGVVGNIELLVSGVDDTATTAGTVVTDNMAVVLACVCEGASRSELAAVIKLLSLDIAAVVLVIVDGVGTTEDAVGVVNCVRVDVSLIAVTMVMLILSVEVTDSVTDTAIVVEETDVATSDEAVSDTSEDVTVSSATVVMVISVSSSVEATFSSATLTDSVDSVFRVSTELVNTVIEGLMKMIDPLPAISISSDMLEFCAHTHLQLTTMRDTDK